MGFAKKPEKLFPPKIFVYDFYSWFSTITTKMEQAMRNYKLVKGLSEGVFRQINKTTTTE